MLKKLSTLREGEGGRIARILGSGELHRRLLDLGLTRGTTLRVERLAPLGGVMELRVGNTRLSIRRSEADNVLVGGEATEQKADRPDRPWVVGLAGNPNSGKTALFNALVGTSQRVGNWPGVTVERKEGQTQVEGMDVTLVDLPGTYSLTAYSQDELVARNFLVEDRPDLVINVVDTSNLERSLNLTLQLMELGVPIILDLNLYDEAEKLGVTVDTEVLSELLGVPVVTSVATRSEGIDALRARMAERLREPRGERDCKIVYSVPFEEVLSEIEELICEDAELCDAYSSRWLAVKLFEDDQPVYELLHPRALWLNLEPRLRTAMAKVRKRCQCANETFVADARLGFIRGALRESFTAPTVDGMRRTDKVDAVLLNRYIGLPIFFAVLFLVFQATFILGEIPMAWIEGFFGWMGKTISAHVGHPVIRSALVDGIVAGVGGVLVFLPSILILFVCLSFLEDVGYMARVAYLVDHFMHRLGLHGRSFLPMVMGFGCSVPAFMACRTLRNRGDRLATMLVIPLMSCGAKLPVYILLAGVFFTAAQAGVVIFALYCFGVLLACLMAFLLKRACFPGLSEPFVMELPPYRVPSLRSVVLAAWNKAWLFLRKASTIILAASLAVWSLLHFPLQKDLVARYESRIAVASNALEAEDLRRELVTRRMEGSYAGRLGRSIEPIMRPLGFNWRVCVALVAGLSAKEVVVSTLATMYSVGEGSTAGLQKALREDPSFSLPTAVTLMVFVLIYLPCLSATVLFLRESGSIRWTGFLFVYTIALAWSVAFGVRALVIWFQ